MMRAGYVRGVPEDPIRALFAWQVSDTYRALELSCITGTHGLLATMSRALRLEYDDRDDPIVGL